MLKERDIPLATTSARAAAKCDGLGAARRLVRRGGGRGLLGPASARGNQGSKQERKAKNQIHRVFFKSCAQAKTSSNHAARCRTTRPASIELAKNLDTRRTGADYRLGNPDEEPMFDDAGNGGEPVRQVVRIGNGAEEAIHDIVCIVTDESLAAGSFPQADLAFAATGPSRRPESCALSLQDRTH